MTNYDIHPAMFAPKTSRDLPAFLSHEAQAIEKALSDKGAVLFRGFDVPVAEAFDAAVRAMPGENFAYAESLSNAVRFNMTEAGVHRQRGSARTEIFLHHEMAQTPIYPSRLASIARSNRTMAVQRRYAARTC